MRLWNFAVFLILFSFSHAFSNDLFEPNSSTGRPQLVVKAPLADGRETIITAEEVPESSPQKIKELLNDSRLKNSDVLLSTDQVEVVEAVTDATSQPTDKRLVRIIPIGKLASASQKIAAGFKSYYKNARETVLRDRIGLTVLSITVGFDTFIWIHSASLDIHQKTSMVIMNFVMAATFGLDRDLWSKINTPLKNRLIRVFDRFITIGSLSNVKTVAGQYISNMALGVGIQLMRTGLLSMDHIAQAVMTTDFWMNAVKISGLVTLTAFTWSELYGSTEAERNPVAKMMLKRLGEMRGIILSQLASISMVLQPQVYGHVPVYTFIVHGAIGLIALSNAHLIVNWLETSPAVNKLYKRIQTFEDYINSGLNIQKRSGLIRTCEGLFAR